MFNKEQWTVYAYFLSQIVVIAFVIYLMAGGWTDISNWWNMETITNEFATLISLA